MNERGAVAVTVALLIVPLLVLVGLGIDIGMLANEKRSAQIAADNAALAAAFAGCHGGNPQTEGQELGAANGFPGVSITDEGDGSYSSVVTSTIDTAFAKVVGIDTMDARAEAEAQCKEIFDGLPALFAGSDDDNCDRALSWSSSGGSMIGDVHSNGDIQITGSGKTITGDVTYADDDDTTAAGIDPEKGQVEDDPGEGLFRVESYMKNPPGDKWVEATNAGVNRNPSGTGDIRLRNRSDVLPGLYYTTGNITIEANNVPSTPVTFVSNGGAIRFGGNSQHLTPWDTDSHLLAFATRPDCRTIPPALQLNGPGSEWSGIFYAPNGQVQISGSGNAQTVYGSIIAAKIDISPQGFVVDATLLQGEPKIETRLTK